MITILNPGISQSVCDLKEGEMLLKERAKIIIIVWIIASLSCTLPGYSPEKPTPVAQESPATNTVPEEVVTNTPTNTERPPTLTLTSTPTSTLTPTSTITPSPTISPWAEAAGVWSGCVENQSDYIIPCADPLGGFVTLYLTPHCTIGEYCGKLVRGAFYSEAIHWRLTLVGINGPVIYMDAAADFFGDMLYANMTIELSGNRVRVVAAGDNQWTYELNQGCDPVIVQHVIGQCPTNL
jgi:hypothetical protein